MNIVFNTDGQTIKDATLKKRATRKKVSLKEGMGIGMYVSSSMENTTSTLSTLSSNSTNLDSETVKFKKGNASSEYDSSLLNTLSLGHSDSLDRTAVSSLEIPATTQPIVPKKEVKNDNSEDETSNFVDFNTKIFENLDLFLPSSVNFSQLPQEGEAVVRSPLTLLFDDLLTESNIKIESSEDKSPPPKELVQLMALNNVFDGPTERSEDQKSALNMSYQEENKMLKHFFKKLLPLLDAHPRSPWPDLALRYCDFDVARSCFISLACIHIYESREGGNEYYKQGIVHMHRTMNHLIQSISSKDTPNGEEGAEGANSANIRSFVIIVLVNVHILFAVLEKGKLSLSRYLFQVFASLCEGAEFYEYLKENENKWSLVLVLSWYDTVSAIVSPDCRLPYCSPEWYGTLNDDFSTIQMMGCPGEIFKAMLEVCYLRHEVHEGFMEDDSAFENELERVKLQLLRYRDYIKYDSSREYILQLKGAQCWALAVYVTILRIFKNEERQRAISAAVNEFIDIYGSMPSESPTVTQMVWPIYAISCECVTLSERAELHRYMVKLYDTAQMGTLGLLRWIVEQVWEKGLTQEEILLEWLETGVDYLPL